MESPATIAQLVDRVDRLLLRYEEMQRTNQLLQEELRLLTNERDSLASRLSAARLRVDTLIRRLPEPNGKIQAERKA